MSIKKRLLALLVAGLIVAVAVGCAQSDPESAPEPDAVKFVACTGNSLSTLDPALSGDPGYDTVLLHLFENLMKKEADTNGATVLVNGMAKDYTKALHDDGTVSYTFHLRESSRWSDNEPLRAEHFVFSWKRLADPAKGYANGSLLQMVLGYEQMLASGQTDHLAIKALDEHTLQVTLSYDSASFLSDVCTHPATFPLRMDMFDENGILRRFIPGNGPYMVDSWDDSQLLTLQNPHYYEVRAIPVDALQFRFVASAEQAYSLYQNGEVDFIHSLPAEAADALHQAEDWGGKPYAAVYTVLFNNRHELFFNPLVRQAFLLSVDYAALEQITGAMAEPATGLVPWGVQDADLGADFRTVGGPLLDTSSQSYDQRCAEAQACLEQAGYPNGEGFPTVEYCYLTGEMNHAVAQALADMWNQALGITLTLRDITEEEQHLLFAEGAFDLAGLRLTTAYDDSLVFLGRWRSTDPNNLAGYTNQTYDVLMGVTDASQNAAARVAFLHDAEAMLLEDAGLIPLYFYSDTHLLSPLWTGVFHDDMGRFHFVHVQPVSNP